MTYSFFYRRKGLCSFLLERHNPSACKCFLNVPYVLGSLRDYVDMAALITLTVNFYDFQRDNI